MYTWDSGRQRLGNQRELNPNSPGLVHSVQHIKVFFSESTLLHTHLFCASEFQIDHFTKAFPSSLLYIRGDTVTVILIAQTQSNGNYGSTKLFPLLVTWIENGILLGSYFPQDRCHGDHLQNAYMTLQQHIGVGQGRLQLPQKWMLPQSNGFGRRNVTTTLSSDYKTGPRKTWEAFKVQK